MKKPQNLLPHTEDEYRRAMKYFKQLATVTTKNPEQEMGALAIEALRFATIRKENPPLTSLHLMNMHGQPVYCHAMGLGRSGGGIVNANKEEIILLDHSGVWRYSIEFDCPDIFYRFPLNGIDLLAISENE